MKPTKQNVERRCKELGVVFEYTPECGQIGIVAPEGYHFKADVYGFHYADFPVGPASGWTRAQIYEGCLECLADGLEQCEEDCECKEEP